MKRLLLIITLVFTMALVGCSNSTEPTYTKDEVDTMLNELLEDYYTKDELDVTINDINAKLMQSYTNDQIDTLLQYLQTQLDNNDVDMEYYNTRITQLETMLDNLVVSTGLNGQTDYYINQSYTTLSASYYEFMSSEKDFLDASKFPSYIFDEQGEYININQLGNLLTQKYLGINSTTTTGFQYKIQAFQPEGMSNEEYITRLSMMIIELSNLDFYTIDSPQLYIEFVSGGSSYMTVRMSLLVSDKYELHPAIFWEGLMDTHIENYQYDVTVVEALYNDYITNETFTGYVLNY